MKGNQMIGNNWIDNAKPSLADILNRKIDVTDITDQEVQHQLIRELFHVLWGKANRNSPYDKQRMDAFTVFIE